MIESRRRPGIPEKQQQGFIRTGSEGFADSMVLFPRLKEWENHIALQALREKKTVDELRSITPFRQYLGVERRAYDAGTQPWEHSFTTLFAASPSIDLLVSLGNFHTIRTWTWSLAQRSPDLQLPLEDFFQDALYRIVPGQAKAYDPSYGSSFTSFVVEMLKKRFSAFAKTHKREQSAPVGYEEKAATKKGRPAARRERVMLMSLDAPMQHTETPQTVFEFLETTRHVPQDTTQAEDREAKGKIHLLSQLAGLNDKQEETLVAMFIYGGDTKLISELRRSTSRSVRGQRQTALERIQELGYETVNGILTGKNASQRR